MLGKKVAVKLQISFLMLMLLVVPQSSFAYWGVGVDVNFGAPGYNHYYGWHDHPQWGWHVHYLPAGYASIWVHGVRYYYYDGLYYNYVGQGDYVLVNPPVGAYVDVIPRDFQPVLINGRTYYTDHGIFYILTRHRGYRVVAAPAAYR